MVGSGDLVLTDITNADSALIFPDDAEGRYFIRTVDGLLVSELNKVAGTALALAVPKGRYIITLVTPPRRARRRLPSSRTSTSCWVPHSFRRTPRAGTPPGRRRTREVFEEITEWTPIVVGIVPRSPSPWKIPTTRTSRSDFAAKNRNIRESGKHTRRLYRKLHPGCQGPCSST